MISLHFGLLHITPTLRTYIVLRRRHNAIATGQDGVQLLVAQRTIAPCHLLLPQRLASKRSGHPTRAQRSGHPTSVDATGRRFIPARPLSPRHIADGLFPHVPLAPRGRLGPVGAARGRVCDGAASGSGLVPHRLVCRLFGGDVRVVGTFLTLGMNFEHKGYSAVLLFLLLLHDLLVHLRLFLVQLLLLHNLLVTTSLLSIFERVASLSITNAGNCSPRD